MHTFTDARWREVPFQRKVLVGVTVAALIAGVAVARMATASAATNAVRQDSFESGAFSTGQWVTKAASFGSTGAHDNRRFAHLVGTGAGSYLTWPPSVVQQGQRSWSVRAWIKVDARGADHSVGLLTIRNKTGIHNADLFIEASTGRCRVDLLSSDKAISTVRCDDKAWHLVEMRGDYGTTTYTLDWRLDGVAQPPITSTGQPASTVMDFWIGDSNSNKSYVLASTTSPSRSPTRSRPSQAAPPPTTDRGRLGTSMAGSRNVGHFTYTPAVGHSGPDAFSYQYAEGLETPVAATAEQALIAGLASTLVIPS